MTTKRKAIPKKIREAVYNKYGGRCAYCGKAITYKEMQVDHLIPLGSWGRKYSEEELECFENYMPTDRTCNHYKRCHGLESFREMISEIPKKLYRDSYIYKVGINYGIYDKVDPVPIKFYFEIVDSTNKK
jgi:hypothetical protein